MSEPEDKTIIIVDGLGSPVPDSWLAQGEAAAADLVRADREGDATP